MSRELDPEAVLRFWFGEQPYDSRVLADRMHLWFNGGTAFDERVGSCFGAVAIELAGAGSFELWRESARGTLALILVLDQLPRHLYRGKPQAFACDAYAKRVCLEGLARGVDRDLSLIERQFFYLPLQHSEELADQLRCVALFETLLGECGESDWIRPTLVKALEVARVHEGVIRRYGRYPHRNVLLERPSTLHERMYLDAGGPTFGQGRVDASAADPPRDSVDERAEFRIASARLRPAETVCVDGTLQGLRCLSHWPGTLVPAALQHDLSTGMALAYARLSRAERLQLLGPFSVVTNDHYDTDGALAAFALIEPELALSHEQLLLDAAATGDFRTHHGAHALALDLTVWALTAAPGSPLFADLARQHDYLARAELCYRWLIAELPTLLREPMRMRALWEDRFTRIEADLRAVDRRDGVAVELLPAADLAIVTSRRPLTRHGLVHAAGRHYRVLYVVPARDGQHYRFFYRNESWFLGIRDRVPPRWSLEPARSALARMESASLGHWWSTPLDQTSPQLGFGDSQAAADVFGDVRPELDPPSRLSTDRVVSALLGALGAQPVLRSPSMSTNPPELP